LPLPVPPRQCVSDYLQGSGKDDAVKHETVRLIWRLCKYFRGQHHLEEIMWRENVTRKKIKEVFAALKDVVVVVYS